MNLGKIAEGISKTAKEMGATWRGEAPAMSKMAKEMFPGGFGKTKLLEGAEGYSKWGRRLASPKLLMGAAAVGAGAAFMKEKPGKYLVNQSLDAVLGSPDVDNNIMGFDMGMTDLLPLPGILQTPNWMRPRTYNFTNIGTTATYVRDYNNSAVSRAMETQNEGMPTERQRGYEYPYTAGNLPYRPTAQRVFSSGDIVLGQYNARHGF